MPNPGEDWTVSYIINKVPQFIPQSNLMSCDFWWMPKQRGRSEDNFFLGKDHV